MNPIDYIKAMVNPHVYAEARDKIRGFMVGEGFVAYNLDFSPDFAFDLPELVDQMEIGPKEKLEAWLRIIDDLPCYVCWMGLFRFLRYQTKAERQQLIEYLKSILSVATADPRTRAAEYALQVDLLEDDHFVQEIWFELTKAPQSKTLSRRLAQSSGPVPTALKTQFLADLARESDRHYSLLNATKAGLFEPMGEWDNQLSAIILQALESFPDTEPVQSIRSLVNGSVSPT
ncbi:MAG: hypothetical protein KDK30_11575 [Leptospiraceae bacterium]|nr:hypothetical protein [Leptospiraceae bacterium]MCB1316031.1 hypothetical protein [Leptospiraceae bacterium]